jgi:NADH:ubiquinone oxidoreductase subunit F (NADH-binding)
MTALTGERRVARLLAGSQDYGEHLRRFGPLPRWEARPLADEMEGAGLGGRGGAAFPAWRKLLLACDAGRSAAAGRRPIVAVNAMEGEPASDKARVLLTRSAHLVLDGAETLAAALGAGHVAVCVPADHEELAWSVERAVASRPPATPVEVRRLAGRYVAGEETALVAAIAGGPGLPRFRPDKSVPLQVGRSPVLVHNLETVAGVALVARFGAAWWSALGSPDAPGTCLVTLSGDLRRPGVVEVATGERIGDLLAAGEPVSALQAALVGGYGGSWVGAGHFGTRWAPAALREIGASAGPGILAALSVDACGLRETARIATWMAAETAGQCGPCLFGLPAIVSDLRLLADGDGDAGVLTRLRRRCGAVEGRGACRHPDGVARLVRSALAVFAADLEVHVGGRPCAGSRRATVLPFPDQAGRP